MSLDIPTITITKTTSRSHSPEQSSAGHLPSPKKSKKKKKVLRRYKAVLFDWKGTLHVKKKKASKREKAWSESEQSQSQSEVSEEEELSAGNLVAKKSAGERAAMAALVQEVGEEHNVPELLRRYYLRFAQTKEGFTTRSLLRYVLKKKLRLPMDRVKRALKVYFDTYLDPKFWRFEDCELYPGAIAVLERLKKEGIRTGIIRNCSFTGDGFRRVLENYGLAKYFDVVVSAPDYECLKPSRPVFEAAVDALGMRDVQMKAPESFLYIGNETDVDVAGANRMLWHSCLLRTTEETSNGLATYEKDDWKSIADEVLWPKKAQLKSHRRSTSTASSLVDAIPITQKSLDINPFIHAVAGHRWQENKQGMLRGAGKVYKPLQPGIKGAREKEFYAHVSKDRHKFPFVPRFYGVRDFVVQTHYGHHGKAHKKREKARVPHMDLQDITEGYNEPCVLDVKVGLTTVSPNASDEKRLAQQKKYPNIGNIGYCVAGLRRFDESNNQYVTRDRQWGRELTADKVQSIFEIFFHNGVEYRHAIIEETIERLRCLRDWLDTQTYYRYWSASVLLVYEGDTEEESGSPPPQAVTDENDDEESSSDDEEVTVRLIDFANVERLPKGEKDTNFIHGLDMLINDIVTWYQDVMSNSQQEKAQ